MRDSPPSLARLLAGLAIAYLAIARAPQDPPAKPRSDPPNPAPPQATSLKDRLAALSHSIAIIAVLFFFNGWLFANSYLRYFGLSHGAVSFPVHNYYFFSINVLLYLLYTVFVPLIALAVFAALYFFRNTLSATVSAAIISLAALCWFVAGIYAAPLAALDATKAVLNGEAPSIQFVFKDSGDLALANVRAPIVPASLAKPQEQPCEPALPAHMRRLCAGGIGGKLFLIVQTSEHYIVYYKQEQPADVVEQGRGWVYHVPASDVALAVTLPNPPVGKGWLATVTSR